MEIKYKVYSIGRLWTSDDIERKLSEMLEDGWRLVSTISGSLYNYMIFERIERKS